jgi:hypothetical protein
MKEAGNPSTFYGASLLLCPFALGTKPNWIKIVSSARLKEEE